tara:strand:- start:284 stop:1330 length:1047 start_codon:yes stop_codon:yes gene_type:complete
MPINFLNTIRIDEAAATPKVIEFGDEFIIDSTTNFTALNNLVDGGVTGIGVTDSSSVFSYAITAAPTGVILNADGAAKLASNSNGVNIIAAGSTTGIIQFRTNSSAAGDHYLGLRAPTALTGTLTYTLPLTAPTDGQVLSSTAGGVMSWATGGGSDTNIANTDLTLDADRTTDLAGFDLVFDTGTTDVMTLNGGTDDVIIHQGLDVYERLSAGYIKVKAPSPFAAAGLYATGAELLFVGTSVLGSGTCVALGASAWGASLAASEVTAAIGLMGIRTAIAGGILIRGMVYLATDPGGAQGDVVYLSATNAGELTTAVPTGTAGYVVRVMGYKVATNVVFFSPSKDWIVI